MYRDFPALGKALLRIALINLLGMSILLSCAVALSEAQPAATSTSPCPVDPGKKRKIPAATPVCLATPANSHDTGSATAFVVQAPNDHQEAPDSLLKDATPLLQSLIWPVFIGLVLLAWRKEVTGLLNRPFVIKHGEFELQVDAPREVPPPSTVASSIEKFTEGRYTSV
jgi:hypothetical protein